MDLYPSTLLGYRAWKLRDGYLMSTGVTRVWENKIEKAECVIPTEVPHKAPDGHCHCGLYATYDMEELDYLAENADVVGLVCVKGDVLAHKDGMRVEEMCILALAPASHKMLLPNFMDSLHKAGRKYDSPVFNHYSQLEQEARKYDILPLSEDKKPQGIGIKEEKQLVKKLDFWNFLSRKLGLVGIISFAMVFLSWYFLSTMAQNSKSLPSELQRSTEELIVNKEPTDADFILASVPLIKLDNRNYLIDGFERTYQNVDLWQWNLYIGGLIFITSFFLMSLAHRRETRLEEKLNRL